MGKNLEGGGLIEDYSENCLVGMRKTTKISVPTAGVLAEIRTEHLLDTSLERYRYTSLLGEEIIKVSLLIVRIMSFAIRHLYKVG
jgi:hypothetical protein